MYEYKTVSHCSEVTDSELNELAEEGWEVVSVSWYRSNGWPGIDGVLLRRQVEVRHDPAGPAT